MSRTKPLILDIDDDEAGRYATGRQLKQAGFDVIPAGDGKTGLELALEHQPDLILLDVRLPDIDGFEVCRRIRERNDIGETPIIQMSASFIDTTSRIRGLDNGADAYLTEPVDPGILLATVKSVLRLRRAEQQVRTSNLRWQTTFDAIQHGLALLDEEGAVVQANKAFVALIGEEPEKIAAITMASFRQLKSTGVPQAEEIVHGTRTLSINMDPVNSPRNVLAGAVCVVADITEKKMFDQQLRHTAKLESIGVLAGGIAHDFNNLLTGILGNASLLMEALSAGTTERELASEILKAGESAADLTRQILAYSGRGRFVSNPVDLSAIALESRPFVRRFIPPLIELNFELAPDLPLVHADPGQMQQILMNLIINAAESFPEGAKGSITVKSSTEQLDERFFRAGEVGAPGEYAVLTVSDTGSGMDEATQGRIFDPFFTTKFAGRGLGLSAVHGIIRGHAGFLRLQSAPGQGSSFRLYFPADRTATKAPPGARKNRGRLQGTVLVIDDEAAVRAFAKAALESMGLRTLVAENGFTGVELFRLHHRELSIVVLDLTMPVMTGEQTFDCMREIDPAVPVILSSGFNQATAVEPFRDRNIAGFLGKPYTAAQLAHVVAKAVKKTSSGRA